MTRSAASAVDHLLDEAEERLDAGEPEPALELCERALALEPDHPGAHYVRGDALRALGELARAAEAYRAAALARPDHSDAWSALALTRFELLEFEDAWKAVGRALAEDPRNPEAWWVRGLLLEWEDRFRDADRNLLHAAWIDPEGHPAPLALSDEDIEAVVEEVLVGLPAAAREYLANTPFLVAERPEVDDLRAFDPPALPTELLATIEGPTVREIAGEGAPSGALSRIVLYRRNIARRARDRDELLEELRVTVLHEVGHFLGLDEDDLWRRGLD